MKVIFIKDLKGKGRVNDIKEVSDGYAVNFLIKNGYAVAYTKGSAQKLDNQIKEKQELDAKNVEEANKIKQRIEKETIKFVVKTGKDGRVFGSISTKQIADKLNKKDYKIDKKNINIKNTINTLGFHNVEVSLHKKVVANLKIQLTDK